MLGNCLKNAVKPPNLGSSTNIAFRENIFDFRVFIFSFSVLIGLQGYRLLYRMSKLNKKRKFCPNVSSLFDEDGVNLVRLDTK